MIKIMKERWAKNEYKLRQALSEKTDLNKCNYNFLVGLTFETIYNLEPDCDGLDDLDVKHITEVDNGDYQGTLMFLIPFNAYQPSECEYILTYIGYGSCSGCDALKAVQDWGEEKLTETQINGYMKICKDLICNAVKPYNYGWRHDEKFETVEMEKTNE